MPHIHDTIDFTSEVFIVYQNKVLLRKHDKYNLWLGVGGHIELNEDPNEAAIREVKEEVGLEIALDNRLQKLRKEDGTKELIPPYFLNRNRISPTHEHVTLIFFATATTDSITQTKKEQSKSCKWFTKEEILHHKDLTSAIRLYALEALKILAV